MLQNVEMPRTWSSRASMQRGKDRTVREWFAMLDCGTRLTFESRSIAPAISDTVPCRQHGYCVVQHVGSRVDPRRVRSRARSRTRRELVEYIHQTPGRTLSTLRSQGFTLRLVHEAVCAGEIEVDDSGRVTVATPG